tara:strand:+ start:811 stop:1296 length:486 start_codon:yes stop_codon:yes gene_type:complete
LILTLIVAMSRNRVIGRNGDLPWRLPEDLKHFKQVTLGMPVIMGRKTWDSLYIKPLPNRRNIVVTRNPNFTANGTEIATSIDDAIALVMDEEEAIVIGGATLFEYALHAAERFHLTEVHAKIDGDTYFPYFDRSHWQEISRDDRPAEGDSPAYSFVLLERT